MKYTIAFLFCVSSYAQTINPTTIIGPISTPFGVTFAGKLQITAPDLICAGVRKNHYSMTYTITAGEFASSPTLYPTDACKPAAPGTNGVYMFTFIGADGSRYSEYFGVPTSATPVAFSSLSQLSATGMPWSGPVTSINGATGAIVLAPGSSIAGAPSTWPNFSAVATSGLYSDLIDPPAVPAPQVQSDWTASSGLGKILNKPTVPSVATTSALLKGDGAGGAVASPITDDGTTLTVAGRTLAVGATVLDPNAGLLYLNLPKWRLALAKARTGLADAKLLCVGDSTTFGSGSATTLTIAPISSYPWRLYQILSARGIPAAPGLIVPKTGSNADSRWVVGAGWTYGSTSNVGFGSTNIHGTSPGGSIVFTPGQGLSYDSFDVYYAKNPGQGVITMTATGGTPVVVDLATATFGTNHSTVVAASAGTANAVTITGTGGQIYVLGIEPFLSTTPRVRVANAGTGGSQAQYWTGSGPLSSTDSIANYAPDLTIISLGINDAGISTPAATVQGYLTTIITAAQASGDVILLTFPPSQDAPYITMEPSYWSAYKTLSTSLGLPLIDIYSRWNKSWNASWMNDHLHPNSMGYMDMAAAVDIYLRQVQ